MPFPLHLCCETWKLVPKRFKNFSVVISAFPFNCLSLMHLVHTFESLNPFSTFSLSLSPSLSSLSYPRHHQTWWREAQHHPRLHWGGLFPAHAAVQRSACAESQSWSLLQGSCSCHWLPGERSPKKKIYKNKKICCFPSGTPPAVCTVYPWCRLHTLPLHNTILSKKKKKKKKVPMLWVLNPLLHNSVLTSGHLSPTSGLAVGMSASH